MAATRLQNSRPTCGLFHSCPFFPCRGRMASQQLHVVVLPYPAQGHLPPLLHLSRKLAARGIIVTVVNVDSIHKQLLRTWTCPAGSDIRLAAVPFQVEIPMGYDAACQENRAKFPEFIRNMKGPFELLMEKLEPPASCIVADEFIFWTKETAKAFGVPSVSYWPGNAAWSSVHQHLSLIISKGDLPLKESREENGLITYIPGLTPTSPEDLPEYFHKPERQALEAFAKSPGKMPDAAWVFVNSFYELELQAYDAMKEAIGLKYVSVGPLFPVTCDPEELNTSLRPEDTECLQWLDAQAAASVLYISFGSCSTLNKAEFEEFAYGLQSSKQPFIWVCRPDMVQNETQEFYKQYTERSRLQGLFVSWAPQLKLLAHSSVGGFLTHCGWNSTFESICNGVPMLGWPRHSDQSLNCKLVEKDWQIGFRFAADGQIKRAEVQRVIRQFMDKEQTKEIRKRVATLKDAATKAAAEGGSSYRNLEAFAEELGVGR